jgi:hypothetical protein
MKRIWIPLQTQWILGLLVWLWWVVACRSEGVVTAVPHPRYFSSSIVYLPVGTAVFPRRRGYAVPEISIPCKIHL